MKNRIAICIVAGLWLATLPARAADGTWNANSAGNWSDTTKWASGIVADGADYTATFGNVITNNITVTLDSARTIGHLSALDTTHNYTISGANTLTLDVSSGSSQINVSTSGRSLTISAPVVINDGLQTAGSGTAIISGAVTLGSSQTWNTPVTLFVSGVIGDGGSGYSITKTGAGRLALSSDTVNNTFSGGLNVNGGEVEIRKNDNGTTDTPLGAGNVNINGGAVTAYWTYSFTRAQGTGAGQVQITGGVSGFGGSGSSGGTFNIGNVVWGSATFNPSEFLFQTALANTNGKGTFQSNIDLNGADRTIRSNQTGGDLVNGYGIFSGNITNSSGTPAGLVKTGIGQHILSGANTYDGGTTINQGTLRFDRIAAMPSAGNVAVNDGTILGVKLGGAGNWSTGVSGVGTLGGLLAGLGGQGTSTVTYSGNVGLLLDVTANSVYTGNISDVGTSLALHKVGTFSLALSGANTYSGGTHLRTGTLQINSASAIGTGKLTIYGGTIDNTSSGAITLSTNNPVEIAGNFTFTGTKDLNLGSGTVTGTTGGTQCQITVSGGNLTLGGNISSWGTNGLIKAGNGKLVLSNTASTFNTWIGISGGVLEVTKLANGGQPSSIGQAGNQAHQLNINNGTLRYVGAGDSTDRLLRTSVSGTGITINLDASGTGALKWTNTGAITYSTSGQTRTINFLGDNTDDNTFSPQINDNGTGVVTVNKSGSGTWVLTNNNGFSGGVNVNGGTLLINNTAGSGTGSGAVTVASGAKLGGTGIITGSVTVNSGGTLAPGASIQSLATGTLTLNAGSTFAYEIDKSVARSVGGDLTAVTGNLALAATNDAVLTLTELGATGAWAIDDKLTLISYSGSWNGGLFTYNSSVLTNNSTFSFSGVTWKFRYDDTTAGSNFVADLTNPNYVTMTVIPEPNTLGMLAVFGFGILARRRLLAKS